MTANPATGKMLREPDERMRKPDRTHLVKTEPFAGTVTVTIGDREVARTSAALALNEADFRTIFYLPRADVDMASFAPSERVTFCPYKGDAIHYSYSDGAGEVAESIAWSYEVPYPALEQIAGYVAFYPNRAAIVSDPPLKE